MKEEEAMGFIKQLVEQDQFLPLLFSEVAWFEKNELDEFIVDKKHSSDSIPGFYNVVNRVNELLKIHSLDEMVNKLVDGMATTWALEIILSTIGSEDYSDTLSGRVNREKVRKGLNDTQIKDMRDESRKLLRFMEHLKVYLGKQVCEEIAFQKKHLDKATAKTEKPKGEKGSGHDENNKGYG